jgi:hypothetical protein
VTCSERRAAALEPYGESELLGHLEKPKRAGDNKWMAFCKGHGDKNGRSLSVRLVDGKWLFNCFASCGFDRVVSEHGLDPRRLFPPAGEVWVPKQSRRDREREAREEFERFLAWNRPPSPERMKDELRFVGHLLLGGTRAYAEIAPFDHDRRIRTPPLRLLVAAIYEIVQQGTPRRWFSPLAISRELDRVGGPGNGKRHDVFLWARLAAGMARRAGR